MNQPVKNAAQKMKLKTTKKYSIVKIADLILKKDMEHKEIMRRKKKKTWKLGVQSMNESSEKAMEVNIELRWNVDKLQDDKTFKVKSDIHDSD